jgi:hypothetical protein
MITLRTLNLTMGYLVVLFISCSIYKGLKPFVVAWNSIPKIDVTKSVFAIWPMVIKSKCLFLCFIIAFKHQVYKFSTWWNCTHWFRIHKWFLANILFMESMIWQSIGSQDFRLHIQVHYKSSNFCLSMVKLGTLHHQWCNVHFTPLTITTNSCKISWFLNCV